MKRLAVLLLGLNVAAWLLVLGLSPELSQCAYPTGAWVQAFVNCHDTSRLVPIALAAGVASLAFFYYRSPAPGRA